MERPSKLTIQDIAAHAKVSKSSVSRVLNNRSTVNSTIRDAVLGAIGDLGYQPNQLARSLAGGRSMTIGILTQNIGTPFYDAIIRGIIMSLAGTGYSPIFVDGQFREEMEDEGIETLLGRRVDGLVLVGGDLPVSKLESLRESMPMIVVARELPEWTDNCIYMDNFEAGMLATKFLIDLGHREIAHIKGDQEHEDALRRYEGYCAALENAGIKLDPNLVYEGNFYGQAGSLAIESLLERGKNFSAIFAANDLSALGARLALYRRGIRVPEEVSLIGIDDQLESAFMTPPLTTFRQPAIEMGEAAGHAITSLIEARPYDIPKFHAKLQLRESAAHRR